MSESTRQEDRGPVPPEAVVPPPRSGAPALQPEHLYKAVALAFLLALVFRFFGEISEILLIIYAAAILAVALNIVVGLFPWKRRWVAAGLGLLVVAAVGGTLWVAVPALAGQIRSFAERIPEFQQELQNAGAWLREATGLNVQVLGPGAREFVQELFTDVGGGDVLGRARGMLEVLLLPLLVLFGALYAVGKPNDRLLSPMLRAVPRDRRLAFRRLLELLGGRIRGWVAGTLIAMVAVGGLTTLALYLLGAPYALILGLLNGLLEFVPIIGPWIGGSVAVAVTFMDDPQLALWVLLVVVAIQQLESNLITPLVMSRAAEVHPFVTLFAIFLFGSIFGFLGVLLAVPLVLLFWTIVEVLWVERTIDTDEDPIDPVVTE